MQPPVVLHPKNMNLREVSQFFEDLLPNKVSGPLPKPARRKWALMLFPRPKNAQQQTDNTGGRRARSAKTSGLQCTVLTSCFTNTSQMVQMLSVETHKHGDIISL